MACPSRILTAYKDSPKDEDASDHDQGSHSDDNNDVEVNHNGKAPPKLQCYWEFGEEDDSPNEANKARVKRHNNI